MKQTLLDRLYGVQLLYARRHARHPSAGTGSEWLTKHGVTESCALAAAEHWVPPGVDGMIKADMEAARERADASKSRRVHRRMPWYMGAAFWIMSAWIVFDGVRRAISNAEANYPWLGSLLRELGWAAGIALFGVLLWAQTMGELRMMDRLCADWATRLDGKHGSDVLDEVIAWLETRWAWFLPPKIFANDVMYAIGTRRGAPVLAVLERYNATIIYNMALGVAARTRRNEKVPGGWWTRNNVFIHGVRFRDADHRERVRRTLAGMGGGAIQCPNGVYLYAAFSFMGGYWYGEPTSEIWIDLVDRVIDPDFHGSESAAKALQRELVLLGLAAPGLPAPEGKVGAPPWS